jgi:hypothetical protein
MKKLLTFLVCAAPTLALAQSSVDVDPQHYQLVFENDCVRIVRAKFGPGERNAGPYQTNGGVVVALSDLKFERTSQDGQKVNVNKNAGDTWWVPPLRIKTLVNTGDKSAEYLGIAPKGKAGCEK